MGLIRPRDAAQFTWNTARGFASGLKAGLRYRREGRVPTLSPELPRPEFRPMTMDPLPRPPRRRGRQSLRLALLCGEFGGAAPGGVGVYTAHLAEALASRGHDVSVFRSRIGPCRIEPAGYRIVYVPFEWVPVRERHQFLMALHREADRREFDLVESPLWNGNGAAVGSAARWPLVIRLETPFALICEQAGIEYNHAVRTLIAAEQLQLAYATGIIGISRAVVLTVEETYHVPLSFHGRRLAVIPLGLPSVDRIPFREIPMPPITDGAKFLYIGRFEARRASSSWPRRSPGSPVGTRRRRSGSSVSTTARTTGSRPEPGNPTSRRCARSGARTSSLASTSSAGWTTRRRTTCSPPAMSSCAPRSTSRSG